MNIREDVFEFASGDTSLSAVLYAPVNPPSAALVLNGATGVPRDYYRHFARWLATERGIACLTYDYRDFGHSLRGSMRDATSSMSDWALIDQPAARDEMRRRFPKAPLWVIGHSLGGMVMPSQRGIEHIERMICICSGLVHHTDHGWPYQALARLFWFGHGPLLVRVFGYMPGSKIGFGEDLPAPVYWQWRRWCTSHRYYLDDPAMEDFPSDWSRSAARVDMIALEDDETIPPKCVWRLAELYGGNARRKKLSPVRYGLQSVGHIGAFSRRNAALWPEIIAE